LIVIEKYKKKVGKKCINSSKSLFWSGHVVTKHSQ